MNQDGSHWTHTETVAAAATAIVKMPISAACTLTAACGAGGGATVEFTCSPLAAIDADTAVWRTILTLTLGATGDVSRDRGVRAFRLSATTAPCRFDFCV